MIPVRRHNQPQTRDSNQLPIFGTRPNCAIRGQRGEVSIRQILDIQEQATAIESIGPHSGAADATATAATKPGEWKPICEHVDGRTLSRTNAGGFVGTYVGMYASSNETSSKDVADFDWFGYTGEEE